MNALVRLDLVLAFMAAQGLHAVLEYIFIHAAGSGAPASVDACFGEADLRGMVRGFGASY